MPTTKKPRRNSRRDRTLRCRCGKLYCSTEEAARRLESTIAENSDHQDKVRFYECGYHGWHWTRWTDDAETPTTRDDTKAAAK